MSRFKVAVATVVALAMAAPAMAFDVKWSGDFNNRFQYTENGKVSALNSLSNEAVRYVNVPLLNNPGITNEADTDHTDFLGEIKYRLTLDASSDDKKVFGQLGFEWGGLEFGDELDFGGDAKDDVFELRFANVGFELPFDPATKMIVGLQAVKLNKFVWNDTAAGVKLDSKRGDLSYSVNWFRNDYNEAGSEDARDVFALDITYGAKDMPRFNLFGIYSWEDSVGTSAGTADKDTEYWIGAAVDGQAGNIFYGATFVYLGGELEGLGGVDYDREGFLGNVEVTAKIDLATLKLGYLYASGDDDPNDKDLENYDVIDQFTGGLGSVVIFDGYADDNTAVTSPYWRDKGTSTVYARADFDLTDKASVGLGYLWHNSAEDLTAEKDDDIGHEAVARASYKISKNLTAGIQAGYLFGGDAWENLGSATDKGDDLFVSDASIRLKF